MQDTAVAGNIRAAETSEASVDRFATEVPQLIQQYTVNIPRGDVSLAPLMGLPRSPPDTSGYPPGGYGGYPDGAASYGIQLWYTAMYTQGAGGVS